MPFAVTLCLDAALAPPLAAMWQALAQAGIDDDRDALGYPPHVTLAVYPDDAPAAALQAAFAAAAAGWTALPIALAGLAVFPEPSPILWAAPVVTPALLQRQAALCAALPGVAPHPHYLPGTWVPHVTLSGSLQDAAAALRAVMPLWRPLRGTLDRAELVRFRPVAIIASRALAAASPP